MGGLNCYALGVKLLNYYNLIAFCKYKFGHYKVKYTVYLNGVTTPSLVKLDVPVIRLEVQK